MENLGLYISFVLLIGWMIAWWRVQAEVFSKSLNVGWASPGQGFSNVGKTWYPFRFYCYLVDDGPEGQDWKRGDTLVCTNRYELVPLAYYIAHSPLHNETRVVQCIRIDTSGRPTFNIELEPEYILKGEVIGIRTLGKTYIFNT